MANTSLYNSIKGLTGRKETSNFLRQIVLAEDPAPTTVLEEIGTLARLLGINIVVLDGTGAEVSNLRMNRNNSRRTYYLTYVDGRFSAGKKPGPTPRQQRAATLAAAIINGFPKNFEKKRGPSPGWKSAGTLMWLGSSTDVPLYQKQTGGVQKYVRVKGTETHIYKYKGWKIVGDNLVWVGDRLTVTSDKIARAIAEAATRVPEIVGEVSIPKERVGLFTRLFSRDASKSAIRSVRLNIRVANAIRNALEDRGVKSRGDVPRRKLSSIANALRNAIRRVTPGGGQSSGKPGGGQAGGGQAGGGQAGGGQAGGGQAGGKPGGGQSSGKPGGGQSSGKPFSNYIKTKNNGTLDLDATFAEFYSVKHPYDLYSNKDVVAFYNGLIEYILKSEANKNISVSLIAKVLLKLNQHLKAIYNKRTSVNNVRNRLTYYVTNLTYDQAKQIAKKFVEMYQRATATTKPTQPALSFPPLFGRRQNNIYGAVNYANRQERAFSGYGGFGAPAPSSLTAPRPATSFTAPAAPNALRFPSLPPEQKAAIVSQATKNLTPNQKRVVNTAGGAQLVANIVAKAGGANKVKQAATALQTYSKNNAVRMGLTTNIAANAVTKLGGPMNAATAAAITNKIVAAMNQKAVANRAAVKRKQKRKSKPKPKPTPEAPPIRARLLKAMVTKFTKNELIRIAGENALGTKNNKTKNSLVKNFTKFMRRQPKGKKGSVTNKGPKKTKK